jgi:hypothetical protein
MRSRQDQRAGKVSWFVDPERAFTVIALTNTALEGLAGRFPIELRDAIYRVL